MKLYKRLKPLNPAHCAVHRCPFEDWPNRAWPIQPISWFLPKRWGWPCPVRSALKRTPVQDFNSFSPHKHHISKNWRPILPCYYSGLLHSVLLQKLLLRLFKATVSRPSGSKYIPIAVCITTYQIFRTNYSYANYSPIVYYRYIRLKCIVL